MISALLNHLWQSTLFAAAIALLALLLRKNRASVRHSLWLAASVKFLVPFSLFVAIGQQIDFRAASPAAAAQVTTVVEQIGQPFTLTLGRSHAAPNAPSRWPAIPLSIWACGFAICLVTWINRWRSLRRILRTATRLPLQLPIHVLSSPARLEPGVFGLFRPVLLLPENIRDRLTPAQFQAILAHELTHLRRRDNLAAAIHMLVEAIFWFHPLVWWIEHRMVEERERACDQEVLRATGDSEAYAAGILEVCKLYLESPLVCVAGITGSDLKKRIATIMTNPICRQLTLSRKVLLAAAGLAAVAGPILIGTTVRAQNSAEAHLTFEVASVKRHKEEERNRGFQFQAGGRVVVTNMPLHVLIAIAYDIPFQSPRLTGGPIWVRTEYYDIDARPPEGALPKGLHAKEREARLKRMLQTLLTERFQLTLRRETKEMSVYAVVVGKGGPKLKKAAVEEKDCPDGENRPGSCHLFNGGQGRGLHGEAVDMSDLVLFVGNWTDRPILDKTGLTGLYNIQTPGWVPMQARQDGAPDGEGLADPNRPSIFGVFESLGLKLEVQKAPVEMFIIEHAEKPAVN